MNINDAVSLIIEEGARSTGLYNKASSLKEKSVIISNLRTFITSKVNDLIDQEADLTLSSLTEYQVAWDEAQRGGWRGPFDTFSNNVVGTYIINFIIDLVRKPIVQRKTAREKKMGFNAILAGSFDPITLGHFDLIKRSLYLCDKLIIGVGINSGKNPLFSLDERILLITSTMGLLDKYDRERIEVCEFDGLLVDFAKKKGASVLIRGIRSSSDFEYENTLALINKDLARSIETIFLTATGPLAIVSSSAVKEIATFDGHIYNYVPTHVGDAVHKKMSENKHIK